MFIWSVNSEITQVTGLISPCHRPSRAVGVLCGVPSSGIRPGGAHGDEQGNDDERVASRRDVITTVPPRPADVVGVSPLRPEGPRRPSPPTLVANGLAGVPWVGLPSPAADAR